MRRHSHWGSLRWDVMQSNLCGTRYGAEELTVFVYYVNEVNFFAFLTLIAGDL